ncbi:hypothetical protein [Methylobacterium sp. WL7]|uniref:hypothetical protein n=1 Tax=Methylobacterium sp. WL7 TaxID=2603900 RepID=UPI0011C83F85|nr:hypothetical protein [Methylobacterium sp. WL7]TXN38511.1 hypothetical protein FV233_29100 [Methylobacterium sp. WL7]
MIGEDPRADGVRAQQILDDEIVQHLLDRIETGAVDALTTLSLADMTNHPMLIARVCDLQAARAFRLGLQNLVTSGKTVGSEPVDVA